MEAFYAAGTIQLNGNSYGRVFDGSVFLIVFVF